MVIHDESFSDSVRGDRNEPTHDKRGFDDELASYIRQLATREGISLNRAVLGLLRRGAGLGDHKDAGDTVGSSLDHLIGTWTSEEAAEMDRALEDLSYVDEAMWK